MNTSVMLQQEDMMAKASQQIQQAVKKPRKRSEKSLNA